MHTFYKPRKDPGHWLISCLSTGGEFSTAIWGKGVERETCPCCGEKGVR
jgi:hypothetical protein